MGENTLDTDTNCLEAEAHKLAGDASILERFRQENTDYHFPRHLDLAKNPRSYLAGQLGVKHGLAIWPKGYKNPNTPVYQANHKKFSLFANLPSAGLFSGRNYDRREAARAVDEGVFKKDCHFGGMYFKHKKVAIEFSPLITPREKLAIMSGIPADKINPEMHVTMAEDDAITTWHEWQHGRSHDTWQNPNSGMIGEAEGMPIMAQKSEGFRKLWNQTSQAVDGDDVYVDYLAENMSDTVSFLHFLKHGGDASYVAATANARAHGFYTKPKAYRHATFEALGHIAAHAAALKEQLRDAGSTEIEDLAAGIVGEHTMDRETYYEQAILAQARCHFKNKEHDFRDVNWREVCDTSEEMTELWRGYRGYRDFSNSRLQAPPVSCKNVSVTLNKFIHDAAEKHGKNIHDFIHEAEADLTRGSSPDRRQLQTEALALLKHQGNKHPDYADAHAEMHLLQMRERFLTQMNIRKGLYNAKSETIDPAHKDVARHLSTIQVRDQGRALELSGAHTYGMCG